MSFSSKTGWCHCLYTILNTTTRAGALRKLVNHDKAMRMAARRLVGDQDASLQPRQGLDDFRKKSSHGGDGVARRESGPVAVSAPVADQGDFW
jgi:hypothetical protein